MIRSSMWTAVVAAAMAITGSSANATLPDGKLFGTIMNNDINNLLLASSGANITPAEYRNTMAF